jgi:hypothetical protein
VLPCLQYGDLVSETPEQVGRRGSRLSAVLVGLLAVFAAGLATQALDINDGLFYVVWLVVAVGSIGITTLILVPRARSQPRSWPSRGAHRS